MPCSPWAAPGVGLWDWHQLPSPKPCSEDVSELLPLQPHSGPGALPHSQILVPFPARCHCPALEHFVKTKVVTGALHGCQNLLTFTVTGKLCWSSGASSGQSAASTARVTGGTAAPREDLFPQWGQMEAHRLGTGKSVSMLAVLG